MFYCRLIFAFLNNSITLKQPSQATDQRTCNCSPYQEEADNRRNMQKLIFVNLFMVFYIFYAQRN